MSFCSQYFILKAWCVIFFHFFLSHCNFIGIHRQKNFIGVYWGTLRENILSINFTIIYRWKKFHQYYHLYFLIFWHWKEVYKYPCQNIIFKLNSKLINVVRENNNAIHKKKRLVEWRRQIIISLCTYKGNSFL